RFAVHEQSQSICTQPCSHNVQCHSILAESHNIISAIQTLP
ncbi:hypothetical protein QTG54_005064, partial [Skeletonema marinoi]